jgi:hypothetical protein
MKGRLIMKKLIAITLCAVMAISFTACANNSPSKDNPQKQAIGSSVEIPSPFVDCNTMDDAGKIAGFTLTIPETMPKGYALKLIQAVENDMVQVFYENGEKEIIIRKAKSSKDISGDHNEYKESNTMTVDSLKVSTRGNDGKVNVATWSDGEFTYEILSESLDSTAISDMISSMNSDAGIGGNVEIPNPFVDCDTLDDAKKIAGFTITIPEKMPEGYEKKLIQAVDNGMVQVFYENGEKELIIRKAKGSQDISGDYNEYKESKTITVGSLKVSTRGNNGKVIVATWVDGDYSYSINTNLDDKGFNADIIRDMVGSIR